MSERSTPTALPRRPERDDSALEPTTPAADPQVLRRVVEALGGTSSAGSPHDQR